MRLRGLFIYLLILNHARSAPLAVMLAERLAVGGRSKAFSLGNARMSLLLVNTNACKSGGAGGGGRGRRRRAKSIVGTVDGVDPMSNCCKQARVLNVHDKKEVLWASKNAVRQPEVVASKLVQHWAKTIMLKRITRICTSTLEQAGALSLKASAGAPSVPHSAPNSSSNTRMHQSV